MSSGLDLRKRGARRSGKKFRHDVGPLSSIDAGAPGETRLSNDVMVALNQLYMTSPSIQAARAILQGQLLSSGIRVRRDGKDIKLRPAFEKHLEKVWLPFAKGVIDAFLQFGFVCVSLEEEDMPAFGALSAEANSRTTRDLKAEAPDASDARKRGRSVGDPTFGQPRKTLQKTTPTAEQIRKEYRNLNLIPTIPDIGCYEVSFVRGGRMGYKRYYRVFATGPGKAYQEDPEMGIFFKTPPDESGNFNSPIACVFQSASFISALEELALNAEVIRARQQICTQPVARTQQSNTLDPANLFFDSESRAIQSASAIDDDQAQAQNLSLSVKLCNLLNKMQTTNPDSNRPDPNHGRPSTVPPEVPPRLFTVPERQQVVPGLRAPEARSDLVDLIRVTNDHIAAAMGVPASVIFEGVLDLLNPVLCLRPLRYCCFAQASSAPTACRNYSS